MGANAIIRQIPQMYYRTEQYFLITISFFHRINARQYQKTASAGMGMGAGGNMSGMPGQ